MKKLLFTVLALCMGVATAFAVPAKRGVKRTLKMSDGTRVEAELQGDENLSFYRTADGRALRRNAVGDFEPVDIASIHQEWSQLATARNAARKVPERRKIEYQGVRKGLVILVNFSNLSMTYTRSDFDRYFNEVGFNAYGLNGSVHDYFYEQSYGKFDLQFDVVGPYDLGRPYSYYGAPTATGNDVRPQEMVSKACELANPDVNYKDYDWDGDGVVEQVYVIYAGYGEAQGADPSTIWPHEFSIAGTSLPQRFDGVRVGTYATSCELHGDGKTNPGVIDGIGTACHEFSHCMGIPDMYDTATGNNYGMDVWDLMDYGCYNDEGNTPTAYTSYERWSCGWLEPVELNSPCRVVDMPCLEESPTAYVVYNDANRKEYYLLENRQQVGFDRAAYGHGMLVLHVDYDASAWRNNQVNNVASHQRMTIIPADNQYGTGGTNADGDPFPGAKNVTSLTNATTPGALLYNANTDGRKYMNKPIERIDETNGLVSFDFMGVAPIPAPVALAPTNVNLSAGTFTANWKPVQGALRYDVKLTRIEEHEAEDYLMFYEPFDSWYSVVSSTSKDISASPEQMDTMFANPGWTGQYLYRSPRNVRVGKTGYNGWIETPTIPAPKSGNLTVLMGVLSASAGTSSMDISLTTSSGVNGKLATLPGIPSYTQADPGVFATTVFNIDSWSYGSFKMKFSSAAGSGNFYIGFFGCYDGYYSYDEIMSGGNKIKPMTQGPEVTLLSAPQFSSCRARHTQVYADAGVFSSTATSYKFTNLVPGTYIYKVRAVTAEGNGQWSEEITVGGGDGLGEILAPMPLPTDGRIYDLGGREVTHPTHGIYIRNGRKFLVR